MPIITTTPSAGFNKTGHAYVVIAKAKAIAEAIEKERK